MSNASDRRFAGIKSVNDRVIRTDREVNSEGYTVAVNVWLTEDREEIATMIRELAKLGRTDRWVASVEAWAVAVETETSLEWAFLQFSVWTCHAAD